MGQGKFAGQRPAFYHCVMQPTIDMVVQVNATLCNAVRYVSLYNIKHLNSKHPKCEFILYFGHIVKFVYLLL